MGTVCGNDRSSWRNWYRKVYAELLRRFNDRYEPLVAERKRMLFSGLRGRVLEIGAGAGANLPFLPAGVQWIGVDPNPYLASYVERMWREPGVDAEFRVGRAEELPLEDDSADAVLSTLVLCCVPEPRRVLEEIRRVLKPGGRFLFIEHVAARPGSSTRRRQEFIRPVWRRLAGGCHPDRETWKSIEEAGFSRVELEHFRLPLPIAGPHIAGVAWEPDDPVD